MEIIEETLEFFEKFTREECGGSYRKAALRLGVPYQTFYAWVGKKSRTPTLKALEPVLAKLNAHLEFPKDTQLLDYVFISSGSASLSAEGELVVAADASRPLAIEKDWLTSRGLQPSELVAVRVEDDTMAPFLHAGSLAVVDKRLVTPSTGQIYLVGYLGELLFRKVMRKPGGFTLHALDAYTPPVEALVEDLRVFGRVAITLNML